jgi:hypothetical protein
MTRDLNLGGLFEAAVEIAQQREQILAQLRVALESHDDTQALELARDLVGLAGADD